MKKNMIKETRADFTILSRPCAIKLECPYCEEEIEIDWEDVNAPECWSDYWDDIECPECGKTIKLGDWEYD